MKLLLALSGLAGSVMAQDWSISDCFGYYVDGQQSSHPNDHLPNFASPGC